MIHPILIAQERVAFTCSKTKLVVSRAFGEQIKEDWTLALLLCSLQKVGTCTEVYYINAIEQANSRHSK